MNDSVGHSLERDCAEEVHDEHDVGVQGGDVDYLRILRDALDDADVDEDPGDEEAGGDDPVEVVGVLDVRRDVQRLAVPKVLRRGTRLGK